MKQPKLKICSLVRKGKMREHGYGPEKFHYAVYALGREHQPWASIREAKIMAQDLEAHYSAQAIRMWRAQCDASIKGPEFELEIQGSSVFVTGTVHDERRVTVQVIWDYCPEDPSKQEAFVHGSSGSRYRFLDSERRKDGGLMLYQKGY